MDLTIRDWMVIVGVLLIVAVLFDAWRRIRRERKPKVKMKLVDVDAIAPESEGDDILKYGELPNGGARVVERGDILKAARKSAHAARAKSNARAAARAAAAETEQRTEPALTNDDDDLFSGISSHSPEDETENLDWLDGLVSDEETIERAPAPDDPGKLPRAPEPEVFMLNVVARNAQGLRGDDILQILLLCDLRFGDMNFFHRHEFEAGRGAIQFSVANMMQPGVFDIDNMADMTTPGLVFFLTLPGPEDMMKAFDYMLETAQAVARNLGADVLDESRSVLTKQAMEHSRQKIRELERRLLAKAR